MRAAAGGLTLRRGDSVAGSGPSKLLSISVVGLSGGEKEKGSVGVGKSCLCNRFIQPLADDYSIDHISVFSQSDFSGRVVNNDHFLYWGEVQKTNEEGTDFHIQVIEQTEFIDDASFQPFRGSGKSESYVKRCTNTRLLSAEKLMYICKDQLALEGEYEQRTLPDGKFNVDGFLLVFDVSLVPNRSVERLVECSMQIISNAIKVKKPIVIAATKCDEANEVLVRELERLVNRKELKNYNIPVIETSSHESINVDHAFFTLAQLIDKTRGRSRIVTYMEAAHLRRELLDVATEGYVRLLRTQVQDYGVLWSSVLKKLQIYQEYQTYCDVFGKDSAQRLFRKHVKRLKDEFLGEKIQRYFDLLPEVLHEMFPDFNTLGEGDWSLVKERVREHPDFDHFFIEHPDDTTWMEANLFESDENRIPFEILEMPDAETVFKNHLNQLNAHQKIMELRQDFKRMLEEMGCVTPGKGLNELKVLFLGRECFENLPENEIVEIYDIHQREIIQRAKKNFQELLLERADLFYQFRSSPAGTVTQDDILDITESLQEDSRWKALDRLDPDRKLLLFQHLGFVHCPIREHCPAFPHCTDSLVERIVAKKAHRPPSWSRTNDNNHLNLVILGLEVLAKSLASSVKSICHDDEFEHQNQIFSLDYRTISGDVSLPENAFRTQDFLPHGLFCTFSDGNSFEYIRNSLEVTLLSNLEQEDRLPFQGLPLVIVFASDSTLSQKELLKLKEEGQALADSLQCPFIDVCNEQKNSSGQSYNESLVEDALRALIESIRHRTGILNIYKSSPNNAEPDIRIIMCLLCGDPYSVENVLGPLLKQQNCYLSGDRSVAIETQLGDSVKRKVEVILSSYHSATDFRDELIHGFILVYSTKRKASLATLSTFSMNIPELPIQLLAVTENNSNFSSSSTLSSSGYGSQVELESVLLAEGNNLADRLNAHFMTSVSAIHQKSSFYIPFFKEVFEKKSEIEHAFSMDDPAHLDDSGEGTLERPRRQPMPPPRIDSYRIRNSGPPSNPSRSGSGSEIYERLGEDEDRLRLSPSDDSDAYTHNLDSMDRKKNGNREHLVKPSQIKSKKRMQDGMDSTHQQYPGGFFKPTKNSANASPPTYTRPPPKEHSHPHHSRAPLPYSKGPMTHRALPSIPTSASSRSSFQTKGLGLEYPPAPSTPPEPAPMDPSNSYRDPRAFLLDQPQQHQQSRSSSSNEDTRLSKSSTVPTASEVSQSGDSQAATDQSGWVDDSIFIRRSGQDEEMMSNSSVNPGAFTTGRRGRAPPPVKPRSQIPGKLNMSDFQKVSAALTTMQVSEVNKPQRHHSSPRSSSGAPLATSEDMDQHGYAVPRDNVPPGSGNGRVPPPSVPPPPRPLPGCEYAQPVEIREFERRQKMKHRERREQIAMQHAEESDSLSTSSSEDDDLDDRSKSSTGQQIQPQQKRHHRKKRATAIPVAMPKAPPVLPVPPRNPGTTAPSIQERISPPDSTDKAPLLQTISDSETEENPPPNLPIPPPPPPPPPPSARGGNSRFRYKALRSSAPPSSARPTRIRRPPPPVRAQSETKPGKSELLTSGIFGPMQSKLEERDLLNSPREDGKFDKELEKQRRKLDKEMKQRQKDAERRKIKDEKKRQKEEKERQNQEAKDKKKEAKSKMKSNSVQSQATLEDFKASADNPIPVFLNKAISFIEKEGLDAEGLYRVPGNRAHVDILFQKFDEDPNVNIDELDIAVNAVATAVKDFFFKRLPPILEADHMSELESISLMADRSIKILELGKLLKRLPKTNFAVLKFIFQHFVRVTELSKDNCMDSKNLAICWWPTLLQYEFADLGKFEAMRPHLEDIVQTMIDQFRFLFCGQEEVMMV